MAGIFVSYRRDDTQLICSRIVASLADAFGSDAVFFDLDKIRPGEDFQRAIAHAIGACRVQVLLIGPRWKRNRRRLEDRSDVVRLEIEAALSGGLDIVPVLIDQTPFPKAGELPSSLHPLLKRNGMQLSSGPEFQTSASRLVVAVESLVDAAARRHLPGPWPADRWTALSQPVVESIIGLTARDHATGFAAGSLGRRILRRDEPAGRWVTFAELPATCPPKCIAVADGVPGRSVWVGTEGQLMRSDGALTPWYAHPRFATLGDREVRTIGVALGDPSLLLVGTGRYRSGTSAAAASRAGPSSQKLLDDEAWQDDIGSGDLHVSRDGGASWRTGPFRNVNRIAFAAGDPQTIYVATADEGLFVSTNRGRAYTLASNTQRHTLYALAVSPHNPAIVAIGTRNKGTWLSRDHGATFSPLDAGGEVETLAIAFHVSDPLRLLVGTDHGLYESIDGGVTFSRADAGLVHRRVLAAQFAPNGAATIGTDGGGIYERQARGHRWARTWAGGVPAGCGAVFAGGAGAVYVGVAGMLCVTDDDGRNFDALVHLPRETLRAIAVLSDPPPQRGAARVVGWGRERTLIVGTESGSIHRSDDFGASWNCVYRHRGSLHAVRSIVIDHDGVLWALLSLSTVLRSSDRGQTWTPLPCPPSPPTAIACSPPPWRVLVAGTYDAGVFWTDDEGATWRPLGDGLPGQPVLALRLTDGSGRMRVIAGLQEGGAHWLEASTPRWRHSAGLGRASIRDIGACDGHLIAAADEGVWLSADRGRRWLPWSDGIRNAKQVTRVAITVASGCIFAGANNGVFVRQFTRSGDRTGD